MGLLVDVIALQGDGFGGMVEVNVKEEVGLYCSIGIRAPHKKCVTK